MKKPTKEVSASQFWQDQKKRTLAFSKLKGSSRLYYQWESQSVSGKGQLVTSLPERVRMELRDSTGRVQYTAALNGKKFTAYYPSRGVAYQDHAFGKRYLRKFLGLQFSFSEFHGLLVGVLPKRFIRFKQKKWEWDSKRGAYRGVFSSNKQTLEILINPVTLGVIEVLYQTSNKKIQSKVSYSEEFSCCPPGGDRFELARYVTLESLNRNTSVDVQWQQLRREERALNNKLFEVALPEGVQKILLK